MTLLKSGVLTLAIIGVTESVQAQAPGPPLEGTAVQRAHAPHPPAGWTMVGEEGSAPLGPRRAVPFSSASLPLEAEAEMVGTAARIRPRTMGALIGGALFGAVGFAAGYELDNIENGGGSRVGSLTLIGTAGGIVVGAIVGGAVGWLVER